MSREKDQHKEFVCCRAVTADTFSCHMFSKPHGGSDPAKFLTYREASYPPARFGVFNRVRGVSMTDFLTNADHWRRRAEQTRALAANAVKDQGRLLKVAEEYDKLAALAEGRLSSVLTGSYAPSSRHE